MLTHLDISVKKYRVKE